MEKHTNRQLKPHAFCKYMAVPNALNPLLDSVVDCLL